jgi:hypothetical protein
VTRINYLKLRIPVVDIVHIPGVVRAVLDMNLPEHVELDIFVPENMPTTSTISTEDQKALDDRIAYRF